MKKVLKEEILKLRLEGKKYSEIRKELGCTLSVISYHCKNANIQSLNSFLKVNPVQIEEFNKLYSEGLTANEVAIKTGYSKTTVLNYLVNVRQRKSTKTRSQSVVDWRKLKKIELVKYKGGECAICGYNKCFAALQFHHINPLEKDFTIGGKSWKFETLKKEVDKCVLLCANCHIELHNGLHNNLGL